MHFDTYFWFILFFNLISWWQKNNISIIELYSFELPQKIFFSFFFAGKNMKILPSKKISSAGTNFHFLFTDVIRVTPVASLKQSKLHKKTDYSLQTSIYLIQGCITFLRNPSPPRLKLVFSHIFESFFLKNIHFFKFLKVCDPNKQTKKNISI